jgi:predicted CoA-substrate-specific enzyme activase
MANIGIDIGSQNTKVAILEAGKILALAKVPTGFDQQVSVRKAIKLGLDKAGIDMPASAQIRVTGIGRKAVPDISTNEINETMSAAKGAFFHFPSARVVIDAGAENVTVMKVNEQMRVLDFATNDKCAAGAGSFVESMTKALGTSIDDFAKSALQRTEKININAQCVIFAESEVVSLVHSGASPADISGAIHEAIADRISALVRRVGLEKDVVVMGGMANNVGFIDALEKALDVNVLVATDPEYACAIGAAL